jgi:protoporphyrinogen oxidase
VWIRLFPIRNEKTLEDFFINRFGTELYLTFFKSYTEKVWGVSCKELSAEWGAQRVKGLSITKAIQHALRKIFRVGALSGKGVETSLIEQFLYPTLGPGQMWEKAARKVRDHGGEVLMGARVKGLKVRGAQVEHAVIEDKDGEREIAIDYVFSTTDIRTLLAMLDAPKEVRAVSDALQYRDFLTVGLLLDKKPTEADGTPLTDTWMYIHEERVHAGRVQLFHNWQPKLVANPEHGWIGLEYFVNEGDELWRMRDEDLVALGTRELEAVGLSHGVRVIDGTVIRQPKAYPGYFGSYAHFDTVRAYLDTIPNLFPVGRNGMHR